jgi:serine/threonine protein kinase
VFDGMVPVLPATISMTRSDADYLLPDGWCDKKLIGRGHSTFVFRAKHVTSGNESIFKIIDTDRIDNEMILAVLREIRLLKAFASLHVCSRGVYCSQIISCQIQNLQNSFLTTGSIQMQYSVRKDVFFRSFSSIHIVFQAMGCSLWRLTSGTQNLSDLHIVWITKQILEGLTVLHDGGVLRKFLFSLHHLIE